MTTREPLVLYTRAECHLCELAIRLLERSAVGWRAVDIDEDPDLTDKYGSRIPVLQRPDSGRELFYPFGERELLDFIGP